ncbi:hypothetical protein Tco_1031882 [Tanacetum coccineum]|uniref:Tf2-1-like SH3-like domain-containing protein n=1 Tax=Tanacetum coccineum TaxID=301880 RepID=A0ABQ5GBM4_9ASTR
MLGYLSALRGMTQRTVQYTWTLSATYLHCFYQSRPHHNSWDTSITRVVPRVPTGLTGHSFISRYSSSSCSTRLGCPTRDRGTARAPWESEAARDEFYSQCFRLRSLERVLEETRINMGTLWRLMLALEAWAGYTDTQIGALWQSIYQDQREIYDLRRQHVTYQREMQELMDRMDWLSNHKAKIICHEKVVRIPLPDIKVLRVLRERPKEKARLLMSVKASDKKQEEIVMVKEFPEVFLDDLSGLPPLWEIEFQIELNHWHPSSIKDKILTAQKEAVDESLRLQKCLDKVKVEHKRPSGLLLINEIIRYGNEEGIAMGFFVRCAPFMALYGRKYRSPIMWAEVGESQLIGHVLGQETTEKISQIKDRHKAARDLGPVAYQLDFPEELNGVHDTFHVSNLKKYLADPTLQVPLDEIQVDAKLNFVEEPVEILEIEFKELKRSRIAIVKVL